VTESRLVIIKNVTWFFAIVIVCRLYYWQVIRGDFLSSRAFNQHTEVMALDAKRGSVLAQDGSVLAGVSEAFQLYLYKPDFESDSNSVINSLADILTQTPQASEGADPEIQYMEARKKTVEYLKDRFAIDKNWVLLSSMISRDQKDRIENLKYKGIGFDAFYTRFYPEGSMSAQLLGFVGKDANGSSRGYFGIEGFYDRQLKGLTGKKEMEKDAWGNPILIGNFEEYKQRDGRDVVTTINRSAQYIVEKHLREGIERYGAKEGNVIVLDSKTGAVIAMASYPNYDPVKFFAFDSNTFRNPNVSNVFEPGSIFKPLVMAAALNEGLIEPQTQCDICAGPIVIGAYSIGTWDDKYHKDTSMTDVLVNSDNTGMVFVAKKLGPQKMHDYLSAFGFGKKTGIDLDDEGTGALRDADKWKEIDNATTSFGQGIAVTPIQMVGSINAIANNGVWVKPFLVKALRQEGELITTVPNESRRVISQVARDKVSEMMLTAVEKGESKWAKPKNLQVAGKTGTAQIPIDGHYDEKKTIASFVGFSPVNNAKFTMLVSLREPSSSQWGSETAAPLWFGIAKELSLLLSTE
jgi:cell division protein FtsI/penicillin-binding protein 2